MSSILRIKTQLLGQFAMLAMLAIFIFAASGCGEKSNPISSNPVSKISKAPAVKPEAATPVVLPVQKIVQTSAIKPVPEKVTFAVAEAAFNAGEFELGIELFTAYTEDHESNPWGHYMLGLSALKTGDTEVAIAAFNTSLELDSSHVKSWLNKTRALLDERRNDEALFALEQVFELDSASSVAFRLKGRSLHATGHLDDAADAYRDALRIDDRDVWAMNNLALILIEQEQFELAVPALARAVQIRNDIAYIYNNLGMALERTYRFRDAEDAYANAVAADATHTRASSNLERVKNVTQDSGIEPADLDRLAINFIDEIESWGDENIDRELPLTAQRVMPVIEF